MAGIQTSAVNINFTNCRKADFEMGGGNADLASVSNYGSIDQMRTRLTAISASYYTAAKLNEMSVNDMVYAVRSHDDGTSIADYTANYTP